MSEKCVIMEVSQPVNQRGTTVRKALTVAEAVVAKFKADVAQQNNVAFKNVDGTEFEFPVAAKKKKPAPAPKPKAEKKLTVVGPVTEAEEKEKKNAK